MNALVTTLGSLSEQRQAPDHWTQSGMVTPILDFVDVIVGASTDDIVDVGKNVLTAINLFYGWVTDDVRVSVRLNDINKRDRPIIESTVNDARRLLNETEQASNQLELTPSVLQGLLHTYQLVKNKSLLGRRDFLKVASAVAGVAAIGGVGIRTIADNQTGSHVKSLLSRPMPSNLTNASEVGMVPPNELDVDWQERFKSKVGRYILPALGDDNPNKVDRLEWTKNILIRTVQFYYINDPNFRSKYQNGDHSIEEASEDFLDKIISESEKLGIPIPTAIILFTIGANNSFSDNLKDLSFDKYSEDVKISRAQYLISILGSSGISDDDLMRSLSFDRGLGGRIARAASYEVPIPPGQTLRFLVPESKGLFDIEAEIVSEGIFSLSNHEQRQFAQRYPGVIERFNQLRESRKRLERHRDKLDETVRSILLRNPSIVDDVFYTTPGSYPGYPKEEFLTAIGIGPDSIDPEQFTHRTLSWMVASEANRVDTDNQKGQFVSVRNAYVRNTYYNDDPIMQGLDDITYSRQEQQHINGTYNFFSEQMWNPAFIEFMREKLEKTDPQLWKNFVQLRDSYYRTVEEHDSVEAVAARELSDYEYDYEFQFLTGMAMTNYFYKLSEEVYKRYENIVGLKFDSPGVYEKFITYLAIGIREVPSTHRLTFGKFAQTVRGDIPYNPEIYIDDIMRLISLMNDGTLYRVTEEEIKLGWLDGGRDTFSAGKRYRSVSPDEVYNVALKLSGPFLRPGTIDGQGFSTSRLANVMCPSSIGLWFANVYIDRFRPDYKN